MSDPADPEVIATAVLDVPGVIAMSFGPFGQFRSYLPGGRTVPGVRLDDDHVDVNIVAQYGVALPEVGAAIRRVVGPHVAGLPVYVHVDDVVGPGEMSPDAAATVVEEPPAATPATPTSAPAAPSVSAPASTASTGTTITPSTSTPPATP